MMIRIRAILTKKGLVPRLNEQQILMLQMLKNPLPEEDFIEIRRLAVKLLSKKLDEVVGDWEKQNDITEKSYDKLSKGHFRSK